MKYTYKDHNGDEKDVTYEHIHELTDRLCCAYQNFDNNCIQHPAFVVAKEEITAAHDAIWKAY